MRGKEYLCAIRPCGDGLLLETLHYADEIRKADPLFSGIADEAADEELLSVARQLIERKAAPFDPDAYADSYDTALRELIEEKRKSGKTSRARTGDEGGGRRGGENVVDLMSALKESLKEDGGSGSGGRSRKGSGKASSGGASKSSGSRSSSGAKGLGGSKSSTGSGRGGRKKAG
jgi:DNA end-binding protein Ku